jgi:hypothetical protein
MALAAGLVLVGCIERGEPVDHVEIVSRVKEGDARAEAVEALSDAWYHSTCDWSGLAVQDVFLYGAHDRRWVTIVVVYSRPTDSDLVVDGQGIFDNDLIASLESDTTCQPPLSDAFE